LRAILGSSGNGFSVEANLNPAGFLIVDVQKYFHAHVGLDRERGGAENERHERRDLVTQSVMNENPPASGDLKRCWREPSLCSTSGCHDTLQGQLLKVWLKVAETLKYTIVHEYENESHSVFVKSTRKPSNSIEG
jgi:hypothetical protein